MKRAAIDLAALETCRMGCPERWVRELVAETGRPMTDVTWSRYWRAVTRLAQEGSSGAGA